MTDRPIDDTPPPPPGKERRRGGRMNRHATCPWCDDGGPHMVRGRRAAQLLTDTVVVRLDCRICSSAFEIQEIVTPAVQPLSPVRPGPTAGVAQDSQQGRREGMGNPVPARGCSTGGHQQPGELVPVAPIAEEGTDAVPRMGVGPTLSPGGRSQGKALPPGHQPQ